MKPDLEAYMTRSRAAQTPDELFLAYADYLSCCGFNRVAYAIISDHPELTQNKPFGVIHSPSMTHWVDRYFERNYTVIDPLYETTVNFSGMFNWEGIRSTWCLTENQKQFFNEALYDARLFQGVTYSIHGAGGSKGVALVCSDSPREGVNPENHDRINLATYQYHTCFLDLMNFRATEVSPLSHREADVLLWAATGLTKSNIGKKMNISEHTVDYHTRNIMQKLRAKNITAALAIAIKNGFVRL